MRSLPDEVRQRFIALMDQWGVSQREQANYLKWLRFYFDFCHKYSHPLGTEKSRLAFDTKLAEKNQSPAARKEAWRAVGGYLHMNSVVTSDADMNPAIASPQITPHELSEQLTWPLLYQRLENAIRVRHYSPKTLSTYRGWIRKFQGFIGSRDPETIEMTDVKAFLTHLAVEKEVAASTQNQAFNTLLFLFRHVLEKEFAHLEGVVRAKRKAYIPVVLARHEIDAIIELLEPPFALIASLLYGCGLRLNEGLKLRIQDVDFDAGKVIIHNGKGGKDRTLPLPDSLHSPMQQHVEELKSLHTRDLEIGFRGVFLPSMLEKKYRSAALDFGWQWFFPASGLTKVPKSGELRRYHVHESTFQKAFKRSVRKAQITKRASAHTLRHSFASHLLAANYKSGSALTFTHLLDQIRDVRVLLINLNSGGHNI